MAVLQEVGPVDLSVSQGSLGERLITVTEIDAAARFLVRIHISLPDP